MKSVAFIYENQSIEFVSTRDDNVMVNATQMAKIFGKRVDVFMKSDHAQAFIEVLLSISKNGENKVLSTPNGGDKFKYSKEEILKANKKGGTWMHRILALKFAAWLDPKFEVWVFETIDTIILGHYKEVRQASIEKIIAQKKLEEKKQELLQKYPEFNEFLTLHSNVSNAERKKSQALKASVEQLKLGLFDSALN